MTPAGAPGGGPVVGPYTATATGTWFFDNDVTANEGNGGTTNFNFTLHFDFTGSSGSGSETVRWDTSNGTAVGGASCVAGVDYITQTNQTFTTSGEPSADVTHTVTVQVCTDSVAELDETFNLTLTQASGGEPIGSTGTGGTAVGTITNDDGAAGAWSIGNGSLTEPTSGTQNMPFTVTFTRTGSGTVSVTTATSPVSATAGAACGGVVDYLTTSGTVTSTSGQANTNFTATVNVPVCGDSTFEPTETFNLVLSSPSSPTTITTGTGVGTITDNTPACTKLVYTAGLPQSVASGVSSSVISVEAQTASNSNICTIAAPGVTLDDGASNGTFSLTAGGASITSVNLGGAGSDPHQASFFYVDTVAGARTFDLDAFGDHRGDGDVHGHGGPSSEDRDVGLDGGSGVGCRTRIVTATIQDLSGNTVTTGPDATLSVTFSQSAGTGSVTGLGAVDRSRRCRDPDRDRRRPGSVSIDASPTRDRRPDRLGEPPHLQCDAGCVYEVGVYGGVAAVGGGGCEFVGDFGGGADSVEQQHFVRSRAWGDVG